ncbi:MAG: chemotaxis protein CheX [Proteobacteria bacterium]|nr:chemotaxis protein CheX [Pseudomonadota bacterium]
MEATQTIRKILTTSTFDVFEKMFYIFLEISATGKQQYDLATSIRFSGPFDGEIRLGFSDSLVLAMVENMLNVDQHDATRAMREDCAKEAVNMIGGQFLRTLDSTKIFHMAVPVCLSDASAAQQDGPAEDLVQCLNFESEKGHLYLLASLKDKGLNKE